MIINLFNIVYNNDIQSKLISCFHRIFIILCLFALNKTSFAQNIIVPKQISIEDGLSQGFISSLIQDEEGFLWMGTKNGLNRYDGERFEIFTSDVNNPHSISGDYIYEILDNKGFLLVGTNEGFNLYHKKSKQFYKIPLHDFMDFDPEIVKIIKTKKNQYWITEVKTGSLFKVMIPDKIPDNIQEMNDFIENIRIEKNNTVKNLYPYFLSEYQGQLLYISRYRDSLKWRNSFKLLNTTTTKVSDLDSKPIDDSKQASLQGLFFYFVFKDKIAVTLWGDKKISVFFNNNWNNIKTDFKVNTISYLPNNNQILIEDDNNYMIFKGSVLEQESINKNEALTVVPNKKIHHTKWVQDNSGNSWIGTAGYGILKIGYRQSNIKTYFKGKSIYAKPFVDTKGNVCILNPVTSENLFINTSNKTLNHLKKNKDKGQEYFLSFLVQDQERTLWGLYWKDGLFTISKETDKGSHHLKTIGRSGMVYTPVMKYDKKTHSLLIVFDTKLVVYSIENNNSKSYDFQKISNGFINRYDVIRTYDGHYWIGTNLGLVEINPYKNRLANFKLYNKKNGLLNNQVASLYPDQKNNEVIWIGTKGGGLHRLNMNTMTFDYINSKNGLPNDVIYGILEDDNDNLWMSSNYGIISYNKLTKEIRNFNEADGLQSNEFNTYAYAKGTNGEMYFGGVNGLNVFHPSHFDKNKNVPKVWITELEINNNKVTHIDSPDLLSQAIEHTKNITLPYSQNSISLEFAALEYTASSKNKLSYYLDGAEKEWAHTTTDNKANYLNISPGEYTFKIKAINGDGIGNDHVKNLSIKILSPWYRTTVAYSIYGFIFCFSIWLYIKLKTDRIRAKQKAKLAELDNELLKTKIAYKQKDLIEFAATISENQKWGNRLLESIQVIKESKGRTKGKHLKDLEEEIKNKTFIEKNKIHFKERIDTLNNEFYQTLLEEYPSLSKTELKICSLIRLSLDTNDIASIQNITQKSVYKSRNRIRNKLNLPQEVDLDVFLKSF